MRRFQGHRNAYLQHLTNNLTDDQYNGMVQTREYVRASH